MKKINYQHLFYFWTIANEGSVTRASEKLFLAQPTLSAQLSVLEKSLGEKLFHRRGKTLQLTETGRVVLNYANQIFAIGHELGNYINGNQTAHSQRLTVGIADALPKLIAYRILEPAIKHAQPLQLTCYEDKSQRLFNEIELRNLDIILSDTPTTPSSGNRAFNHLLGESTVSVFGSSQLAKLYLPYFPNSLKGAPFLLPTRDSALRMSLDQWFDTMNIYPKILAEIEDSALLKTFGSGGNALFVAPTVIQHEISQSYQVKTLGTLDKIKERFYAITLPHKAKHPAISAILEHAQSQLLSSIYQTQRIDIP